MSYGQAMKWAKKHPKGTKQQVICHVNTSGRFWPSGAFLEKWREYAEECERQGKEYMDSEQYYKFNLERR